MTQNQLQLMKIREDMRHNKEMEDLTAYDYKTKRKSAVAKAVTDAVGKVIPSVKISKHI